MRFYLSRRAHGGNAAIFKDDDPVGACRFSEDLRYLDNGDARRAERTYLVVD